MHSIVVEIQETRRDSEEALQADSGIILPTERQLLSLTERRHPEETSRRYMPWSARLLPYRTAQLRSCRQAADMRYRSGWCKLPDDTEDMLLQTDPAHRI